MVTVSGDEQSDLDMDTRSVSSISNESDIDSGLHVSNATNSKENNVNICKFLICYAVYASTS